jgi:hypothetical protein
MTFSRPRGSSGRVSEYSCAAYTIGLIGTVNDDYGNDFARHSDSATFRTIGIYVFLRTLMCSPVRAITIAQSLKIPRAATWRLHREHHSRTLQRLRGLQLGGRSILRLQSYVQRSKGPVQNELPERWHA